MKKKESILYFTVVLTFAIGAFVFMPAVAKEEQDKSASPPISKVEKGAGQNDDDTNIQKLMQVLGDKEKELARREDALKKEEERLNMLKNSLELSLKEYSAMRDKLRKELAAGGDKNSQSQQGVGYIAKIYESMSPEEAAQRIEKMDSNKAVALLSRIKSKQAGKILSAIPADKAASLTEKIAEKGGER